MGLHIASLGRINAPQMALSIAVFRVFADRNINEAVVHNRDRNQVVSRGTRERVQGSLGIAVEFPQQFGFSVFAFCRKAIQITVTAGKQYLSNTVKNSVRWRRPLAVKNVGTRRFVAPQNFP